MGDEPGRRYSDLAICRRLLGHGRQFWPHLVGVFFLALVAMPLALLAPVPLKIGVDSFVDNEPLSGPVAAIAPPGVTSSETGLLVFVALLVVAIGLATEVQRLASSLLGTYTGERMELEFRAELFRHAQRTSLSYHDERGTTDSLYRIFNDGSSIQWIGVYGIAPLATAVFTVGGMIIVTMAIDAKLAIIALAVAPVLFLLTLLYRRRLRSGWIDVKERETESLSVIQETLGALRLVKAFRREDHEHERFRSHSRSRLSAHVRVLFVEGSLRLLVGLFVAIGTAAVLYVGLHDVKAGVLTLGDFLLVMGYLAQLYNPLQSMSQSAAALQASIASADRAFALLDQDVEVQERPDALPLERATGAIAFRNVTFGYDPNRPILHDVTFRVPAGAMVGVVGATGAGKSTLASLLGRFYDPVVGEVMLDGHDVRNYRVADLRSQLAFVFQESVLFSTTIAENIAYARPGATDDAIHDAAEAAHVDAFVARLPEGYSTIVGDRGLRLSGGERQRIALARAFLADAPILVLDEPTSSVDIKTERLILNAIERLACGRTTFMIAHRLSTLESCDLLLEIEAGRVVTFGSDVASSLRRRLEDAAG